jgi:hypothetical protein
MAQGIVVEVKGAKELRRALRQIEDAAERKGMQADLKSEYRTAARVVEIAARQEAPKRSGRLAGSIKAKGTTTGSAVVAGGLKAVPYAGPIHWGWPSRPNKSRRWRGGPIAANRFMVRAAESSADQVAGILEGGLRRFIDKVADGRG